VRAKLDLRPSNGFMLVALRSFGYRLDVIDGAVHAQAPPAARQPRASVQARTAKMPDIVAGPAP
jgi:arylamine N-acetyltransferase